VSHWQQPTQEMVAYRSVGHQFCYSCFKNSTSVGIHSWLYLIFFAYGTIRRHTNSRLVKLRTDQLADWTIYGQVSLLTVNF